MGELLESLGKALKEYGPAAAFYGLAALILASAAYAVVSRRIVHSAFALMACFSGVAGIYAMLGSDFLAVAQVVVYVGGIMVLVVFGVLLTDRLPVEFRQLSRATILQGLVVAVPVLLGVLWAAVRTPWPVVADQAVAGRAGTTEAIGKLLLSDYLFPFEFSSVLLLLALVGAARLARGGRS